MIVDNIKSFFTDLTKESIEKEQNHHLKNNSPRSLFAPGLTDSRSCFDFGVATCLYQVHAAKRLASLTHLEQNHRGGGNMSSATL